MGEPYEGEVVMDEVWHTILIEKVPEISVLDKLRNGLLQTSNHFGHGYEVNIKPDGVIEGPERYLTYRIEIKYVDF